MIDLTKPLPEAADLTDAGRETYLAVLRHIVEHGHAPTYVEIAAVIRRSKAAAQHRVELLIRDGLLRRAGDAAALVPVHYRLALVKRKRQNTEGV